jgi:hypothetical protein
MLRTYRSINWRMILKGIAIVYGVSFTAELLLALNDITPQSNPNGYQVLTLAIGAMGIAMALRVASTTRVSQLVGLGIGLWLVNGANVFIAGQSIAGWLMSSVFVASTVILGRLLSGTGLETPRTLDLSLEGIIRERNSGLLGYRTRRSFF